ncbi:MAG TPA: OsmC family protein [Actinomycetota bacterium]|nr:OsmC family protein [Actinomycetota bacterium]
MSGYEVEVRNVDGAVTALGAAGPFTLVVDRPAESGGGGLGFNGGQLLHLAVAGCISNDLFREAAKRDIALRRVVVRADGGYDGSPPVSTGIAYDVEIEGDAPREELEELVRSVDEIAEIPNSLRSATRVELGTTTIVG